MKYTAFIPVGYTFDADNLPSARARVVEISGALSSLPSLHADSIGAEIYNEEGVQVFPAPAPQPLEEDRDEYAETILQEGRRDR